MLKVILILIAGLLLSGCITANGASSGVANPTSPGSTNDVRIAYYLGGPNKSGVTTAANEYCRTTGANNKAVNVRQTYKTKGFSDWTSEWDSWLFDCSSKSEALAQDSKNTADKITQSKQICRDLGFKTNTEKFADCALKMMSIQFESTNKVASSGGTKQEIIVKHKNDYDVFDAMLDISNSMLSNNSGSSSSSSSGSGTRCIAQKTHAWGHTVINCN